MRTPTSWGSRGSSATHVILACALVLVLVGCAAGSPGDVADPTASASPASSSPAATSPAATPSGPIDADALRIELLAMLEADQAERMGQSAEFGDVDRTERLKEIIAEIGGWPRISLVGEDAEDAAWAIAQHSDLDPEFQADALELLRAAVDDGDASPGNLAYLEDRVAVGAGEEQVYGTQVGCGADGPEPATPIRDPDTVDERRADAGLAPLADYLAEMAEICTLPE